MNDKDLTTNEDGRWRVLSDADALGEFLTPDQRVFMAEHPSETETLTEERRLMGQFASLGQRSQAERSVSDRTAHDEAIVDSAVAEFLAGLETGATIDSGAAGSSETADVLAFPAAPRASQPANSVRWQRKFLLPVAAAAALILSFGVGQWSASSEISPSQFAKPGEPKLGEPPELALTALDEIGASPTRPRVLSGLATAEGNLLAVADIIGDNAGEIKVEESLCLASGSGQLCAAAGSRLRWDDKRQQLELMSGRARYLPDVSESGEAAPRTTATVAGRSEASKSRATVAATPTHHVERLQLIVAGVQVKAGAAGSAYDIEIPTGGDAQPVDVWRVEVHSGVVHIEDDDGSVARLRAGDALGGRSRVRGRGVKNKNTSTGTGLIADARGSASDLGAASGHDTGARSKTRRGGAQAIARELARARELRVAKRFRAAAQTYEKVLKQYADSPRARTAWVSLGQLHAGPLNRPKAALRAFESYLASGGGPLSEEARLGQISALRSLAMRKREARAIERFLATYPTSSYADALRTRLEKMSISRSRKR